MGSRLKKVKQALTKSLGGETDPVAKQNYDTAYKTAKRDAATTAGLRDGKAAGKAMGKQRGKRGSGIAGALGLAGVSATKATDYLNSDIFDFGTPNLDLGLGGKSAKKTVKRAAKASRGTTIITKDGTTITIGKSKRAKKTKEKKHKIFNPLDY